MGASDAFHDVFYRKMTLEPARAKRVCTTTGLSDCDAAVPAVEVCDNVDNDCNGKVDDGPNNVCGPEGACCVQAGVCKPAFQDSCILNGGQFLGVGLSCKEVSLRRWQCGQLLYKKQFL